MGISVRTIAAVCLFFTACAPKLSGPVTDTGGVRFLFLSSDAMSVSVAGTFNQWDAERNPLVRRSGSDEWTLRIPLPEGRHEYLFVVNGNEWIIDPAAPSVDDGMGGRNSVVAVP